jgi:hypothetical protein
MKYKEAKSLALESLLSNLSKSGSDLIDDELLSQIVDLAWVHQAQEEPRNEVRKKLRDLIDETETNAGEEA